MGGLLAPGLAFGGLECRIDFGGRILDGLLRASGDALGLARIESLELLTRETSGLGDATSEFRLIRQRRQIQIRIADQMRQSDLVYGCLRAGLARQDSSTQTDLHREVAGRYLGMSGAGEQVCTQQCRDAHQEPPWGAD